MPRLSDAWVLMTRLTIRSAAARRQLLVELTAAAAFEMQLLRIRLVAHRATEAPAGCQSWHMRAFFR